MGTNVVSLEKTRRIVNPAKAVDEKILDKDELLRHYVREGVQMLQGLDNLGNFLMGLGVLILGYLLNAKLHVHIANVISQRGRCCSSVVIVAWLIAVVLLLAFMYMFVFHLIAGRSLYASQGDRDFIGKRISAKKMSYEDFEKSASSFSEFVDKNYLAKDRQSDKQLWYATFRYTRYMARCKLMIMNRMRDLLAWAVASGVVFKLSDIWVSLP